MVSYKQPSQAGVGAISVLTQSGPSSAAQRSFARSVKVDTVTAWFRIIPNVSFLHVIMIASPQVSGLGVSAGVADSDCWQAFKRDALTSIAGQGLSLPL